MRLKKTKNKTKLTECGFHIPPVFKLSEKGDCAFRLLQKKISASVRGEEEEHLCHSQYHHHHYHYYDQHHDAVRGSTSRVKS